MKLNRRQMLAGAAGASLAGLLEGNWEVLAQTGARSKINVRIDRDLGVLDPAHRTGPWDGNVVRSVYQRLMKQKAGSAELENDAASEIKQTSPTTIEFTLKPGLMFTDGFGEMTAEDVKFSFERIGLDPAPGAKVSTYRGDWNGLEKVEVTGKYSGTIVMKAPRANLFDIAIADVSGCIVSKKAIEARGDAHNRQPVGSGPYKVTAFEAQRGATLTRNPDHKGTQAVFEEINIRFINDARTTELALRSGEIDFAILPPAVAAPLASVAGLTVSEQPSIAYVFIGMNTEKAPLNDIRVRKAIRLALDVDQMLIAGYGGKAPRLNTLLPPQIFGHWAEAPVYRRNVAEARALLQQAGVPNPRLKLVVLNQPAFQNMALVAQALLREAGITLEVDAQEGGTYWESGKGDTGKNLDLAMAKFNGKHDPNFIMQWFLSSQIGNWNWQRWSSPQYDALYAQAAAELDRNKRRDLVVQAQKLMDESAAYVWLTNETAFLVHRSWLKPSGVPGWLDWQYDNFVAS